MSNEHPHRNGRPNGHSHSKAIEFLWNSLGPSRQIPARPLLGRLPLAGIIPQNLHSLLDYALAFAAGSTAAFAGPRAKVAGLALEASGLTVSALSDNQLGVARIIPIEAHETADYLWGAAAIAAPFVLGYSKTDRLATLVHVGVGIAAIATALLTDYRAARGVGRHEPQRA